MKTIVYTIESARDVVRLPAFDQRTVKAAINRLARGDVVDEMMDFGSYRRFRVGAVLVRYVESEEVIRVTDVRISFVSLK